MESIDLNLSDSPSSNICDSTPTNAYEQYDRLPETNICIACAESRRAVAFVPCAHYVTCLPCAHGLIQCPVCRTKIMACVRIFE